MTKDEVDAVIGGPFGGLFDSVVAATEKPLGLERAKYVAGRAIVSASMGLRAMHSGLNGGTDIQADMDNISALHIAIQILRDHLATVADGIQRDPGGVMIEAARGAAGELRAAGQQEHAEYYDELARRIESGGVVSEYTGAKPNAKTLH